MGPRAGNPLLGGGRLYAGGARLYGTVLPSPGGGKGLSMWHECITMAACYANSSDVAGLEWTRPHLDLVEDQTVGAYVVVQRRRPCREHCSPISFCFGIVYDIVLLCRVAECLVHPHVQQHDP